MISAYKEKYPYNSTKNVMVALSSCSAADSDEQPQLLKLVEWDKVKAALINKVASFEKTIVDKKENQIKEREEHQGVIGKEKSRENLTGCIFRHAL
jgi:fumarylacetoacetate (FAA) hydrolase family protein